MQIVPNEPRKASVREEIRAISSTIQKQKGKKEKKKVPFYLRNEKTLERRRKRRYQRYQSVRKVIQAGMQPCSEGDVPTGNPHVVIDIHQSGHNTNPKADANGEILVCSSTQAKPVKTKMVMQLLP